MALKPQFINIGLSGGVDAKTDRKLVRPPSTLVASNVRYGTAGSVRKRYGLNYPPQPSGTIGALTSLGNTNTELLATDKASLFSYAPNASSWVNRGSCTQASLKINTVGSFQLSKARQLSYDVIGNLGLLAYDTGDNQDQYFTNYLGTINLCLFDTTTYKTIWTKTITRPYLAPFETRPSFFLFGYNDVVLLQNQSTSNNRSRGCAYPVVRAFRGKFYLAYVGVCDNTFLDTRYTQASYQSAIYYLQWLKLADPSQLAEQPPTIDQYSVTNATVISSLYAAFSKVPTAPNQGAQPTGMPSLYFDLATNGFDLTCIVNGQSYGSTRTSFEYTDPYRNASAAILHVTSSTQNSAVTAQTNIVCPLNNAQPVTLAASPTGATLPSTASYVAAYKQGALEFNAPARDPSAIGGGNLIYPSAFITSPLSAFIESTTASHVYRVIITDGVNSRAYTYDAVTHIFSYSDFDVVFADYARGSTRPAIVPDTGLPIQQVLQSRIFAAPDGRPAAWIMLQQTSGNPSFNCLALVSLLFPHYTYAHAFYLRAGNALVGRQACNAPNGAALAYQVTDAANQTAAIKQLSLDATTSPQIVRLNQGALITGADTKYYDGQSVRTCGWLAFPDLYLARASIASGQLIPGTAYSYIGVFVDFDAYGNVIYSSPSVAAPVTLSSGDNAAALLNPLSYTRDLTPSRGQLVLYRNNSKDLLTYRKIPPLTLVNGNYYDLSPDDNTASPQLYSQPSGGELPNDPPPSSLYAVTTQRRAFVSSAENPSWLYFGKPYFPGRPPEFSALQFLDIDPPSGDITGLAVLDQNVIIFKKERIFVLSGDGPDATGAGVFNNTYAVATDAGCLDPKSIVSTESGVYFRSIRGIQLLGRDLAVTYIGAPVEALLGSNSVTSSVLVPEQNQIRFALSNQLTLVYDHFLKVWSTYTYAPNAGTNNMGVAPIVSQATWQDRWYGLGNNLVFGDGPGFSDGFELDQFGNLVVVPAAMNVETGWIPLAGQQGIGRLRWVTVLGDFRSGNAMTLSIAFDYNDTYLYDIGYTPDDTTTPGAPQQWRVRSPRQVGQAVKFRLTEASPGEACVITGLLLETYQKSGASRLPDFASV